MGVISFNKKNYFDLRNALLLAAFVIPGAIVGSFFILEIPDNLIEKIIGYIMLVFAVLTLWRPQAFNAVPKENISIKIRWYHFFMFFLIGFYGGFIQAGVGIFILFACVLSLGYDLINANSIKLALTLAFTPFSLAIFILNDQVQWIPGIIMAVGGIIGAWYGARFAIKKGIKTMKLILFIVLILSGLILVFKQ